MTQVVTNHRDAEADSTSDRILDAARELILERHPSALTVAEIARRAGVSERTIYRYFPTKQELLTEVSERPTNAIPNLAMPTRWDEVRGALRVHWSLFAENLDMLRSERMIPGGIELRRIRLERAREGIDHILDDAGLDRYSGRERLRELLIHLTSSTTLLELVDRHDMTPDDATDLVLEALETLVDRAREDNP
jgi:AcrR family transcriptional regulator